MTNIRDDIDTEAAEHLDTDLADVFSMAPTYAAKVDMLVDFACGATDADTLRSLFLARSLAGGTQATDLQAARDAQQARVDAEARELRNRFGQSFDASDLFETDDPRDAQISPNEQAGEQADKPHGLGDDSGLTEKAKQVVTKEEVSA